jgi:capsular polysaccharide transport system ATP-binding protein
MIVVDRVTKRYRASWRSKLVLDRVSAVFDPRRSYGLLGRNGAGKSTFLRLIAGIEAPNRGRIRRYVQTSWPLGFAGGFHPLMTGRENLRFLARAYGADVASAVEFVEDFSELGRELDVPFKTYSSGMKARLAFAVSMAIDFDFYLVDEITAVGDSRFQARCREAFAKKRERAGMLMVSHSIGTIREYCDTGLVLLNGKLQIFPDLDEAIEVYRKANE